MDIDPQPSLIEEIKLIKTIYAYFSSSQYAGTLKNLNITQNQIPLSALLQLSAISKSPLKPTTEMIADILKKYNQNIFDVSSDQMTVLRQYDHNVFVSRICKACTIFTIDIHSSISSSTTECEITSYLSNIGVVLASITKSSRDSAWTINTGFEYAEILFEKPLIYDGQVLGPRVMKVTETEPPAPTKLLSFTIRRPLKKAHGDQDRGSDSANAVHKLMSAFAGVHSVVLESFLCIQYGYIRLKKCVAFEVYHEILKQSVYTSRTNIDSKTAVLALDEDVLELQLIGLAHEKFVLERQAEKVVNVVTESKFQKKTNKIARVQLANLQRKAKAAGISNGSTRGVSKKSFVRKSKHREGVDDMIRQLNQL